MASGLENPSLMKGKSTEITASEASSVACQAEFNLLQSRNTAQFFIHRMNPLCVGKGIYIIHLCLGQRLCRRILHNIASVSIKFCQWPGCERVCILILDSKTLCIGFLILLHFIKGRKQNRFIHSVQILAFKNSSWNIGNLLHRNSAFQGICDLHNRVLSHSIGNQIST